MIQFVSVRELGINAIPLDSSSSCRRKPTNFLQPPPSPISLSLSISRSLSGVLRSVYICYLQRKVACRCPRYKRDSRMPEISSLFLIFEKYRPDFIKFLKIYGIIKRYLYARRPQSQTKPNTWKRLEAVGQQYIL